MKSFFYYLKVLNYMCWIVSCMKIALLVCEGTCIVCMLHNTMQYIRQWHHHYPSRAATSSWYVGTCPRSCIYMYITMQFFKTFMFLPSKTPNFAYGIWSATASMQQFFYQPLVSKGHSTIIQPYASTVYGLFLFVCACTFAYSLLCHGASLCIYYIDSSVRSLWLPSVSISVVLMYSTRSGFLSLFIRQYW